MAEGGGRWGGSGDTCTLVTVATRGPGLGGTPWAASGPGASLALSLGGGGGWKGVPGVKKGMGSTNQILEEVVVTPEATDEGKRVALVLGLQATRMLCKLKHFLKHRKEPAAHRVCSAISGKNALIS